MRRFETVSIVGCFASCFETYVLLDDWGEDGASPIPWGGGVWPRGRRFFFFYRLFAIINPVLPVLRVDGVPVKVTPMEYRILLLLMKHPGRVFSSDEIYERVWNEKAVNSDTIMVHVRNIREKIEINPKNPKYLKVVWGVGYKMEKQ